MVTSAAIMQPYFFPYLGYFQLVGAVDKFFPYDNFKYSTGGWVNRNRILGPDHCPLMLSVPIRGGKTTQVIRDVQIDNWAYRRKKMLRSIDHSYRRAPYFRETRGLIEDVLFGVTDQLGQLNVDCIVKVTDFLKIETELFTDSAPFQGMEDRLAAQPDDGPPPAQASQMEGAPRRVSRVVEICRELGADTYVNALGGQELYSKEVFADFGLDLHFIRTRPNQYRQGPGAFVADLSIIDVLMHNGRDRTRRLLRDYDLV